MSDDVLAMWTVYDHPRDEPDYWVARLWLVGRHGVLEATKTRFTATSLEALRAMLPSGLHRLERDRADDPVIVETWL